LESGGLSYGENRPANHNRILTPLQNTRLIRIFHAYSQANL
jgi:hypothetical protein